MKTEVTFYREIGDDQELEVVVVAKAYVQKDMFGTGDSPSEFVFDPVTVTIGEQACEWDDLTEHEQEHVVYTAYQQLKEED